MKAKVLPIAITILVALVPTLASAAVEYQLILIATTQGTMRTMPIATFSDQLIGGKGVDGKTRCEQAANGAAVVKSIGSGTDKLGFVCVQIGDK